MLTASQYISLWTKVMNMPIQNIPCYYQYLQREVYFQDYLDLFCCPPNGKPTYERLPVGNHDTILLPFDIDPNPSYTVRFNNKDRLIVDYDYPYTKELCKKRLIKYILIGEAPPAPFIPRIKGGLDLDNSYFYNLTHKKSTSYYNEPLKAWGIARFGIGTLKTNEMIDLANMGVILLDLFPFAHSFSTNLRKDLNNRHITMCFWKDISTKVSKLKSLDPNWDFCFVAPETPSAYIINTGTLLFGKSINSKHDLAQAPDFKGKMKKNQKQQVYNNYTANNPTHYPCSLGHLPKQAKLTTPIGGSGPHWELIKRALNL